MNDNAPPPLVLSQRDGHVLRLTLNRAVARNALSEGLMSALQTALAKAAVEKPLRQLSLPSRSSLQS